MLARQVKLNEDLYLLQRKGSPLIAVISDVSPEGKRRNEYVIAYWMVQEGPEEPYYNTKCPLPEEEMKKRYSQAISLLSESGGVDGLLAMPFTELKD